MKIITGRKIDLLMKLEAACRQVKTLEKKEDRFALYNYIGNLYAVINSLDKVETPVDYTKVFGTQKECNFFFDTDRILKSGFEDNFLKYKSFHNEYLGSVLDVTNSGLEQISINKNYNRNVRFSKNDFYSIFFDFMKSLKLEKDFDKFINNHKMFSRNINYCGDNYEGLALINPINCDTSLVIHNFNYDLESMYTLAHEFGHVFDFKHIDRKDSAKEITSYLYNSMYTESISRMFEKLFLDYMIGQDILSEQILDKQARSIIVISDYILSSYIFSLFEKNEIKNDAYAEMSSEQLINLIGNHFVNESFLEIFFKMHQLNFPTDLSYAYGEIMSSFLKESVDNEGLDSKLMREFMAIRTDEFSPEFIDSNDLSVKQYKKLYDKENERIKK